MTGDPGDRAGLILEIDLGGIVANWRALAARVNPAGCAAVVKADAYGLGAPHVSTVLAAAGCRLFFVATLDEGVALRSTLPASCEIAVLNGPLPGSAQEFVLHQLVPVLNEPGQITNWAEIARRHGGLPAMLHVDTGMARLGLSAREFEKLTNGLSQQTAIRWRTLRFRAPALRLFACKPGRVVRDFPRPEVSLGFRSPRCRPLRHQPAARHPESDASGRSATGKNPANS